VQAKSISKGLECVFADRQSFLVIGLTGRTGSGCTTVSEILSTQDVDGLHLPQAHTPPRHQEDRKYRIIREWTKANWRPFLRIQVSHVITYFALQDSTSRFETFVNQRLGKNGDDSTGRLRKVRGQIQRATEELRSLGDISRILQSAKRNKIEDAYQFFFNTLPTISRLIKKDLGDGKGLLYTTVYQSIGDNIRSSGQAFSNDGDAHGLFAIPDTISMIIEIAKAYNKYNKRDTHYFVVDALRHPFEIRRLRKTIAPFYVFSVATDESTRSDRLHKTCNMTDDEISALDAKEYPSRNSALSEYPGFVSQDIQACVDLADVHISNIGSGKGKDRSALTSQIVRYLALMQHPGLVTPTPDERCMQIAYDAKLNSGCISRQVGAVVANPDGVIQAIGWNDVPRGQVPCLLRNAQGVAQGGRDDPMAYSRFETNNESFVKHMTAGFMSTKHKIIRGRNITFCFKDAFNTLPGKADTQGQQTKSNNQVHTRSLHAEENAFLQIAKFGGQAIRGGTLYTTSSPCELCAKKAYQLGIQRIVYIEPYPGISNDHVLGSGTQPPVVALFSGAIGQAYGDLYNPIMPYKDELRAHVIPGAS
jgi:dCMP deaminase